MSSQSKNRRPPKFAVDTSALLAMMQNAPGGSLVGVKLHYSAISTVNLCEVLEYSLAHNIPIAGMTDDLTILGLRIEPFTHEDAHRVAELGRNPRAAALSLSDRVCLALAQRLGVPALTADDSWKKLDIGIEVQVLR